MGCFTRIKNIYYLTIAEVIIIFPRDISENWNTVWARVWTQVTDSICYDHDRYINRAFIDYVHFNLKMFLL